MALKMLRVPRSDECFGRKAFSSENSQSVTICVLTWAHSPHRYIEATLRLCNVNRYIISILGQKEGKGLRCRFSVAFYLLTSVAMDNFQTLSPGRKEYEVQRPECDNMDGPPVLKINSFIWSPIKLHTLFLGKQLMLIFHKIKSYWREAERIINAFKGILSSKYPFYKAFR